MSARTTPVRTVRESSQSKYATLSNYVQQHQQKYTPQSYLPSMSSPTPTLNYALSQQTRSTSMPSTPIMPKLQFNKNLRAYPPAYGSGTTNSDLTGSSNSFANKVLRDDLLVAADSITGAMQDLVKELNSGNNRIVLKIEWYCSLKFFLRGE